MQTVLFPAEQLTLTINNEYVGVADVMCPGQVKLGVYKLNSSGKFLWCKSYGEGDATFGNSIELTSDNGFIISGVKSPAGLGDILLVKIDSLGKIQWQRTWGGKQHDEGFYAKQTRDGGYICIGYKVNDDEKEQIHVIKTDSRGGYKWIKGYSPSEYHTYSNKLYELSDGSFVLAGMTYGKPTILKITSTGSVIWKKTVSDSKLYEASDFAIASDGGYAICGRVFDTVGNLGSQAALVKTNKNGEF